MADRRCRGESGFTLAEMMFALMILLVGVTALLSALSSSIAQRRTTDARHEAAALCEHALHRLRVEAVRPKADAESPLDLELAPLADQEAEGFPGMTWSATAEVDPERIDLWLITIEVRWLEAGDPRTETFLRVLPRQLPLGARVLAFRAQRDQVTR